jgi:hypothetical protein
MNRVWLGGLRLWIVACVLVIATLPVEAQQCVGYFQSMFEGMREQLGVCSKRNKLLVSFSDAASLEFYAPGSPDAPGDKRGKVYPGGPPQSTDPTYTEASAPDFRVLLPDRPDGRWRLNGDKVVFNCNMPLSPNPMPQNESFLECARVYACGARAARCGLETARRTNTANCPAISQACLTTHPVPRGRPRPPKPAMRPPRAGSRRWRSSRRSVEASSIASCRAPMLATAARLRLPTATCAPANATRRSGRWRLPRASSCRSDP